MEWIDAFGAESKPEKREVEAFVKTPLWNNLNAFLESNYNVKPEMGFSGCSAQPGWNIKYKKSGKALCTLYPMPGFFIALVVIGSKEYDAALEIIPECTDYTRTLFENTPHSAGGRWLMMHVVDEAVLEDAKRLIMIRRPLKKS